MIGKANMLGRVVRGRNRWAGVWTAGLAGAAVCLATLAGLDPRPAMATTAAGSAANPNHETMICRAAAEHFESKPELGIPPELLAAISVTESGRSVKLSDGSRVRAPWPWTINANGKGFYFRSKDEAIAKVRSLLARGIRSIDVGCMQVNLRYHGEAFDSLEEAFDPITNVAYAAEFLRRLYYRHKSWIKAVERYHSGTAKHYQRYRKVVFENWLTEREYATRQPSVVRVADINAARTERLRAAAVRRESAREASARYIN